MQGQKKHKGAAPGWPAFLAEIRLISEPLDPGVEGRVRNLVRTPDGRYFWPSQLMGIRSVTAIIQAQFVQTALDTVEVRVVCARALSPADIAEAVAKTHRALGYPFEVVVVPVESIPRGPTGKFEEFLSLLDSH